MKAKAAEKERPLKMLSLGPVPYAARDPSQRAIQLDADMTYAYTLCGHEYVVNEDFDKVCNACVYGKAPHDTNISRASFLSASSCYIIVVYCACYFVAAPPPSPPPPRDTTLWILSFVPSCSAV